MSKGLDALDYIKFYTQEVDWAGCLIYDEQFNIIEKELERLEKLEKVFSDLKSMFDIKIGIGLGNEYFIEIKQLDTRIAELIIPQEDIEIFKEVFENEAKIK